MLKAPYNFVPLSKFVYFPRQWSDQVSHDIPFSDGISGTINCTFTTQSPIYVRNGGNWKPEDIRTKEEAQSFFKVGDEYIIPGTSIKGMLRNVIEIITFGKIGSRVGENRYSIRDLYFDPYKKAMTMQGPPPFKSRVKTGWLTMDKDSRQWYLTECDYARVEQNDLIAFHGGDPDLKGKQTSIEKYDNKWGAKPLTITFDIVQMPAGGWPHRGGLKLEYKKAKGASLGNGNLTGSIVFTGQPTDNDGTRGRKHMEFIFFDKPGCERNMINSRLQSDFEFIHSVNGVPNEEWKRWKDRLFKSERVPVFFLGDADSHSSMGLAFMYRLAYTHSIHETVSHTNMNHVTCTTPDFADTLLGFIGDYNDLKGRISISHAVARSATPDDVVETVLGTPKPTYFPSYIKQQVNAKGRVDRYTTFMDEKSEIRGWKRYPAKDVDPAKLARENKGTDNVATLFRPLKKGAEFNFKVRFHNVKPVELGALIWAIRWGGNSGLCHNLGMGKPFGYGQVKVEVNDCKFYDCKRKILTETVDAYQKTFEDHMDSQLSGWKETEQLVQLKAMANRGENPLGSTQAAKLNYMKLGMKVSDNEFKKAKDEFLRLEPHAKFAGLSDEDRFKNYKAACPDTPAVVTKETTAIAAPVPVVPKVPQSISDKFETIRKKNDLKALFVFFSSLTSDDLADFEKIDLSQVQSIFNIGHVDELDRMEMLPEVKAMTARKMLRYTKPNDKWKEDKMARFHKLKEMGVRNA